MAAPEGGGALGERGGDGEHVGGADAVADGRTGPVGGQVDGEDPVQGPLPVGQFPGRGRSGQPAPLVDGVVGVLDRQGGEFGAGAVVGGLGEGQYVAFDDDRGPAVAGDVVDGQDQVEESAPRTLSARQTGPFSRSKGRPNSSSIRAARAAAVSVRVVRSSTRGSGSVIWTGSVPRRT